MEGWIKLHRKITQSAVYSDPDLLRLWVLCLTKATHKGYALVIERQQVELSPGEFLTGRKALTDDYNMGLKPRFKKKELSLWRDLKFLEECGNVNIKTTNKYSVVSISKWCEYQESEQQLNNSRTTTEQQLNTNKNVKNDKNEKKTPNKGDVFTPEFEQFWLIYPRQVEKQAAYTSWNTAIKVDDPSTIILCAENYAYTCKKEETAMKFIKHPTTFLNKGRYKDFAKKEPLRVVKPYNPVTPELDAEPLEGYG